MAGTTPVLVHNDGGAGSPLFRSDTRDPSEIFRTGFEPRGSNMDIMEHASGWSVDSGYVATTTSQSVVAGRGGIVYTIRGASGVDVNATFPGNPFAHELEVAVPGAVPSSQIEGATLRDGTWVPNPNYVGGC
ncbi:scabin-related ADP-ribosyltransferase [Streptacidiphilus cavernicola]|uniref:Pierisin-like domain-containing protein n=1 Tax=Streptacidiphilus cavernicola TaxID=3342716 RepID=A0ABV6W568_9ACTN